jgi:hypothetical protein
MFTEQDRQSPAWKLSIADLDLNQVTADNPGIQLVHTELLRAFGKSVLIVPGFAKMRNRNLAPEP